jgi:hypothetical protein
MLQSQSNWEQKPRSAIQETIGEGLARQGQQLSGREQYAHIEEPKTA